MSIATIGAVLTVTPEDDVQIVHSEMDVEYFEDRTPLRMRVAEILREDGALIGVAGPVIDGPERYAGLVVSLFVRLDASRWERELCTQANFKIGRTVAHRVPAFPLGHPEGTAVDGYPYMLRFAEVEAEARKLYLWKEEPGAEVRPAEFVGSFEGLCRATGIIHLPHATMVAAFRRHFPAISLVHYALAWESDAGFLEVGFTGPQRGDEFEVRLTVIHCAHELIAQTPVLQTLRAVADELGCRFYDPGG